MQKSLRSINIWGFAVCVCVGMHISIIHRVQILQASYMPKTRMQVLKSTHSLSVSSHKKPQRKCQVLQETTA